MYGRWVLCVFSALMLSAGNSEARPQRVDQIPGGNTVGCGACHVSPSGGGARNPFGQTVESGFLTSSGASGSVIWNAQLAGLDSDGDGVSNGQELGDPDGDFTIDASIQVTNPGDPNSFVQPVVNRAPVFAEVGNQSVNEGESLTFAVSATDEDGDTIVLTPGELPLGATFEDGRFSWTPGFDQAGNFTVQFTASDGKAQTDLSVQVAVTDVPRPLVIASTDPTKTLVVGAAGDSLRFSVSAESPDHPDLTYTWTVNGAAQAETGSSLVLILTEGTGDDAVSVSVSDGEETATHAWTVARTLKGDFNADNAVDFADFLLFVPQFGKISSDPDFNAAVDINGNGAVDFPDFLEFVRFFGLSR